MADLGAIANQRVPCTIRKVTMAGGLSFVQTNNAFQTVKRPTRGATGGSGGLVTIVNNGQQFVPLSTSQIGSTLAFGQLAQTNNGVLVFQIQNAGVPIAGLTCQLLDDREPTALIESQVTDASGQVYFYGLVYNEPHYYLAIENAGYNKYLTGLYNPSTASNPTTIDLATILPGTSFNALVLTQAGRITVANTSSTVLATRYSTLIGDNSTTSFTITHNLNSTSVVIMVFEIAAGIYTLVNPAIVVTGVNTATVTFTTAPTVSQYEVVVFG